MFGAPVIAPATTGVIFHNPTRPFTILTHEGPGSFEARVRLFGIAACWATEVRDALVRGLDRGIGIKTPARVRARPSVEDVRIEVLGHDPDGSIGSDELSLNFRTPLTFERKDAIVFDRSALFSSLLGRIAGLAAWHGMVVSADWAGLDRTVDQVSIDSEGLHPVTWERFSALQPGRSIRMAGLSGLLRLFGDLSPIVPMIEIAPVCSLGSHTSFGLGQCNLWAG